MSGLRLGLRGLGKSFGPRVVLDALTLQVPAGQFLAVVGRSGCGKTTLLRLLAGLERPSAGALELDGEVAVAAADVRMVFQEARLLPWRSVARNVAVGLGWSGRRTPPEVEQALAQVGLEGARGTGRPRSRAGSASGWPWPALWSAGPASCCWTSRWAPWTRSPGWRCRR
jgi:sulfonate transport system ATP-binding protein